MKDDTFDPRDHEAFVREVDADGFSRMHSGGSMPRNTIPKRRDMNMMQSLGSVGTLFQSGVPFWIPPGDGGSNGLSFTGTRGVFTLSAEAPIASSFNALISGSYCYIPAGAGGLAAGGWFFFKMTDGTNGEIFAETYSGSGKPSVVSSPTAMPNLSAGRITQLTSELYGPAFVVPGGSMGPNGIARFLLKWFVSSTAGNKTLRCRSGSTSVFSNVLTTTYNNQLVQVSRINMGVEDRQLSVRTGNWDGGTSATNYLGDITTINTAVDQTISFTAQIAANTDSIIMVPMQFTVQYGA